MTRYSLLLEGWSDRSVIGYDEQLNTWFARLWRNASGSDLPDLWFNGADAIESSEQLAMMITLSTGVPLRVVERAMQAAMGVSANRQ